MNRSPIEDACERMGHKLRSTDAFIVAALYWLGRRMTPVLITQNPDTTKWAAETVNGGKTIVYGDSLALALAELVRHVSG